MIRSLLNTRSLVLALLFAASFAVAASAQTDAATDAPQPVLSVPAEYLYLPSADLSGLDAAEWARLTADHIALLDSPAHDVREHALMNLAYFATNYADAHDFSVAAPRLYEIYRFDQHEGLRILAVKALFEIGEAESMRLVAQRAPWDDSALVRRVARAVVQDYFFGEPVASVQEPG